MAVTAAMVVAVAGVLLLLDAVLSGAGEHRSQARRLLEGLDHTTASGTTTAIGLVVAVLGLALVATALRPARRTHLRVRGDADVWLTPRAVGALASGAAMRHAGVLDARVERVRRRRVTLAVTPSRPGEAAAVATAVQEALRDDIDRVDGTTVLTRGREDG